jgi:hypothetical protein
MSVVRKIVPVALLISAMTVQLASADTYFDHGRQLFDKRQYAQALPYFHKAAEDSPWDSTSAYYEALCYHQMRDWAHAKGCYKGIIEHFPGSPAYANALAALRTLDPTFVHDIESGKPAASASSSSSAGSSDSSAADNAALLAKVVVTAPTSEQRIPVLRQTSKSWIDASINGHGMKMDFSQGDSTTISPKDAKAMNLSVNNGKAIVTVKVGQISEANFPVTVEETSAPKLGSDFFNQFSYTLEASTLIATKKGGGGGNSSWDVPFRKKGKDMVIDFQCNGRHVSAVLDPDGGESVIPKSRAKEFGLEVSEGSMVNRYDAVTNPNGPVRGQEGFGEVKDAASAEGKVVVGPCSSSVRFKIDEHATDAKVGPSLFGGWKYQVDPASGKLHFTH